jgi:peroxiredoxin
VAGKAIDFVYDTPFKQNILFSEKVKEAGKTFLIFQRYIGCRTCQVGVMELINGYESFLKKNAQALIVLQSTPENVKTRYSSQAAIPFDIVCDPEQKLYTLYNVGGKSSAEEMWRPCDAPVKEAIFKKFQVLNLVHGAYEGNEYQLPALFIVDRSMNLLKEHRAESIVDMPSPQEMVDMI